MLGRPHCHSLALQSGRLTVHASGASSFQGPSVSLSARSFLSKSCFARIQRDLSQYCDLTQRLKARGSDPGPDQAQHLPEAHRSPKLPSRENIYPGAPTASHNESASTSTLNTDTATSPTWAAEGVSTPSLPTESNNTTNPASAAVGLQKGRQTRHQRWRRAWRQRIIQIFPLLGSKELMGRIFGTLGLLALIRVGLFIPLPGLVPGLDQRGMASKLDLQDVFGMESPVPLNIFMLGIGPTINAHLLLTLWQCLPFAPGYEHLKKLRQQGQEGTAVLKAYAQQMCLAFAVIMGANEAVRLQPAKAVVAVAAHGKLRGFAASALKFYSTTDTMVILIAGAMLVRWLTDHMEPWGLGDGISLIICTSIFQRYMRGFSAMMLLLQARSAPLWKVALALLGVVGVIFAGLFLSQIERRYPIVHYRQRVFNKPSGVAQQRDAILKQLAQGTHQQHSQSPQPTALANSASPSDYLPLRIAPSGMSPLLMASFYLSVVPDALCSILGFVGLQGAKSVIQCVHDPRVQPWALALTVLSTNILQLQSNTKELAEWLSQSDVGLRGVVPGAPTARWLQRQQLLMRALGAVALAGMTLATHAIDVVCQAHLGTAIGCTSLLIMASLVASAQRQVTSLMALPKIQLALEREQHMLQL